MATCSTPCIDTNDLNEVIIEIRLVTSDVCFLSCEAAGGAAATTGTVSSYTLKNIGFTISKIVFNDPMYYSMKTAKLLGDGLTIGYNTYINTRGGQTAKTTSMNIYTNINTTSLNQVICVLQDPENWATGAGTPKNLLLTLLPLM